MRQGGQLVVAMQAADLETGVITATAEGTGSIDRLGELTGRLYRRLASGMDRRLPDLAESRIDEAPLSNLHFMKGLAHYHGARYSQAVAAFMLAGEDDGLTHLARFWQANAYLAQEQYAHAYLELSRLARTGSSGIADSDLADRMRRCEQHLSAADVKMIAELAARGDRVAR
jgi:hypothetical protein